MLKIGVVGLGNIAQKAYLPVMAAMQDQVQWVLCTRDPEKLAHLQAKYGFTEAVSSVTALLALQPDAVFIHTPTATHAQLIKQFLTAGVHVYVDKPVSEDLAEVQALYQLAASQGLLLTCGFNRRFAPLNQQLCDAGTPSVVIAQKNRIHTAQPVCFAVFDLFTHVVDTALFLAGPVDLATAKKSYTVATSDAGDLAHCGATVVTPEQTIYMLMNMDAGVNQETAEVQAATGIRQVVNLRRLQSATASSQTTMELPDWTPTLQQRGFSPLINAFVAAVADPTHPNPVSPTSSCQTHQLCTELLQAWR